MGWIDGFTRGGGDDVARLLPAGAVAEDVGKGVEGEWLVGREGRGGGEEKRGEGGIAVARGGGMGEREARGEEEEDDGDDEAVAGVVLLGCLWETCWITCVLINGLHSK